MVFLRLCCREGGNAHTRLSIEWDGDSDGGGQSLSPLALLDKAERAEGRESVRWDFLGGGGEAGAHDEVHGRVVSVSRRVSWLFFASRDNAPKAPCRPLGVCGSGYG